MVWMKGWVIDIAGKVSDLGVQGILEVREK